MPSYIDCCISTGLCHIEAYDITWQHRQATNELFLENVYFATEIFLFADANDTTNFRFDDGGIRVKNGCWNINQNRAIRCVST